MVLRSQVLDYKGIKLKERKAPNEGEGYREENGGRSEEVK